MAGHLSSIASIELDVDEIFGQETPEEINKKYNTQAIIIRLLNCSVAELEAEGKPQTELLLRVYSQLQALLRISNLRVNENNELEQSGCADSTADGVIQSYHPDLFDIIAKKYFKGIFHRVSCLVESLQDNFIT